MGSIRSFIEILLYRLRVSSEELRMAREDRKLMNSIRRNFNEVEIRMRLHERNGGSCSELGGSGVPLEMMGFKMYAYRVAESDASHDSINSGGSDVVSLNQYRKISRKGEDYNAN